MATATNNLSRGQKAHRTRLVNEAMAELPAKKHCPKCDRTRLAKFFGMRVPRNAEGAMTKPRFQSYCIECRSGSHTKAPAAETVTN